MIVLTGILVYGPTLRTRERLLDAEGHEGTLPVRHYAPRLTCVCRICIMEMSSHPDEMALCPRYGKMSLVVPDLTPLLGRSPLMPKLWEGDQA